MRATTSRRMAVLVTAGALVLGGIAAAGPALAGTDVFTTTRAAVVRPSPGGTGMGMGAGMGSGMGMGMGAGSCFGTGLSAAQGTLTTQQKNTLIAMAQEEKLAHDLYVRFADKYPVPVFGHIAAAETRHLSTVRTLLARYGLTDPTAGTADGKFSDPAVQATYDRLLTRGTTGRAAALQVGQEVERTDIADLQKALVGLTAPDVTQVYQHLLAASQHHLTAFTAWATR